MADKTDKSADHMGDYATKHPRRMYSSFFALGTVIGASMMAAKKNHEKNAFQKFIDQFNK